MTNLKAGSGSTVMPVQGPQICPILGTDFGGPLTVALWTPNRHSRGSVLQKEAFFFVFGAPNWLLYKGSNVVPKPTVQHLRVCNKFDCSVIVAIWVAWLVFDILKATFFSPKNPECPWTSPIPILPLHPGMWFFPWLVYCARNFSFSNLQIIVPRIIFKQVFCKTRFFFVQKKIKKTGW